MPDDGAEDGWSIHVPATGFQTTQVESSADPEALPPLARQLRLVVRDPHDADDAC
jgi:hypothetical protein